MAFTQKLCPGFGTIARCLPTNALNDKLPWQRACRPHVGNDNGSVVGWRAPHAGETLGAGVVAARNLMAEHARGTLALDDDLFILDGCIWRF